MEHSKQKKFYDEVRQKAKNCSKLIQNAEFHRERFEDAQNEIKAKDKYIQDLEKCIIEKNKELSMLNQSFLR